MYPKGTGYVYSYFEARKGATFDSTVFFGLQKLLKELETVTITMEDVEKGKQFTDLHIGTGVFNYEGWKHIAENLDGKLPLEIKAVAEGTVVPIDNVMFTVQNTDPKCPWLTGHVETLLTHVWHPSTVATLSKQVKDFFEEVMQETCNNLDKLPFMLHDFGMRGVSSLESAKMGGLGHLVNFMGTDTVPAILAGWEYYNTDAMLGYSVNATEHSIMTSLGREGEAEVIKDLIEKFPTGILSVVSDSYDIEKCVKEIYGEQFKEEILARDGVFVVRPDSGDPVSTVINLLRILDEKFGSYMNDKKFKVLNDKVRLIWGDGIDFNGIKEIIYAMIDDGWSADNIVFGMGGGLLQKVNRDTQRFAFKSSAQHRDGEWHDIFKDPVDQTKRSKKGRLSLVRDNKMGGKNNGYKTIQTKCLGDREDLLKTVFLNGKVVKEYTFEEVRENSNK
jgi:nicotinamide phosphoribosyltransferase